VQFVRHHAPREQPFPTTSSRGTRNVGLLHDADGPNQPTELTAQIRYDPSVVLGVSPAAPPHDHVSAAAAPTHVARVLRDARTGRWTRATRGLS
jgi:hypothetical protein